MSKNQTINSMMARNNLNFNPKAQQFLLKIAVNNKQNQQTDENEGTDENTSNIVPAVANFKSNKLSQIDKKQRAEFV